MGSRNNATAADDDEDDDDDDDENDGDETNYTLLTDVENLLTVC